MALTEPCHILARTSPRTSIGKCADLETVVRETVVKNADLSHVLFKRAVREANGHIEIKLALPIAL